MQPKCLLAGLMLIIWLIIPAAAQDRRPMGEFNAGYSMFTDFDIVRPWINVGIIGNASIGLELRGSSMPGSM
jgi:hypothetical protein